MKSIIIGTAGHIDHGKTALVKALTGIDADRLEEEKRRGITIDIGFAHLELPGTNGETLRLGFVDVPGHERFVRNMLAGVGGIDLVLLVIAADEGIKPQTREHFDICRLLGVRAGVTVLTKSDAIDRDSLEIMRLEVEEFLRGSFLDSAQAPIVAVSSLTGAGLEELKSSIAIVGTAVSARDSSSISRLPIDRVFTMKGFGTIVTGTLISGSIRKDEELEVFPLKRRARVRGVQVHGSAAEVASAGQRTALNLAGAAVEELSRGMVLAPPGTFQATRRADVSLSLLPSAKALKERVRVHFHSYTMETVAELSLYGAKQLVPGQNAFAQVRLASPALLLPGDRFIVRQFSPVVTIGGGVVLDAAPIVRKKKSNAGALLETFSSQNAAMILQARVAQRGRDGATLASLISETGWPKATIENHLFPTIQRSQIIRVGDHLIDSVAFDAAKQAALETITTFHSKNPLVQGIGREQLREHLGVPEAVFAFLLESLASNKRLEFAGELVRLPGQGIVMKGEESESRKVIEAAFQSAGLKVPFLQDVLAGLKVDKARAQKIVTLMLRDKILVKISEDLVFHHTALANLKRTIGAMKATTPKIDVAQFKDLTGASRKYAIPLLEYLDRERVTRRVGNIREIV